MAILPLAAPPVSIGDELTLELIGLNHSGAGLGRVDNWVVMVPLGLPGERVQVRVWRNHKRYSEADLLAVLEPSPSRKEPRCELFGRCGGCQYQHLDYAQQLAWKGRHVREAFQRLGQCDVPVAPVRPSPQQYGYRAKLTPHFRRSPHRYPDDPIGFQGCRGRRVIDVPACPIATDAVNHHLPVAREQVRSGLGRRFKRGGTLLLRHTLEGVTGDPNAVVSERIGEWVFQFQAGEFFQNNPYLLPELVDYVVQQTTGPGLRFLIDVYCGVGVFGIAASRQFERCAGVEVSPIGFHWAQANALINRVDNITFRLGKAEAVFAALDFAPQASVLVIDPPRRGCDASFLHQVFTFGPQRIVYVSCAPETQARDLRAFIAHGYTITAVQPFDLFPQTRHIKTVVSLQQ